VCGELGSRWRRGLRPPRKWEEDRGGGQSLVLHERLSSGVRRPRLTRGLRYPRRGEDRRGGKAAWCYIWRGLCSGVRRPRASMDKGAATPPVWGRIGAEA